MDQLVRRLKQEACRTFPTVQALNRLKPPTRIKCYCVIECISMLSKGPVKYTYAHLKEYRVGYMLGLSVGRWLPPDSDCCKITSIFNHFKQVKSAVFLFGIAVGIHRKTRRLFPAPEFVNVKLLFDLSSHIINLSFASVADMPIARTCEDDFLIPSEKKCVRIVVPSDDILDKIEKFINGYKPGFIIHDPAVSIFVRNSGNIMDILCAHGNKHFIIPQQDFLTEFLHSSGIPLPVINAARLVNTLTTVTELGPHKVPMCLSCNTNAVDTIYSPCRHSIVCSRCSQLWKMRCSEVLATWICELCRQEIASCIKIK